jgi:hypothetical protein
METLNFTQKSLSDTLELNKIEKDTHEINKISKAFAELGLGVKEALETYSNVHRGSGHNSMITSHLFDQAREIVLE